MKRHGETARRVDEVDESNRDPRRLIRVRRRHSKPRYRHQHQEHELAHRAFLLPLTAQWHVSM
jgi:hypothetical protein